MKTIDIYTDGACSGNPGIGGWAAVLIYGEHTKEISGFCEETTNNRMELTAVIKGIECLKEKCIVNVYTDSAYVCKAFTDHWLDKWISNNWKTSKKQDVENKDLWMELLKLTEMQEVQFHKVKGHADNKWNNRCDELATSEIKKNR